MHNNWNVMQAYSRFFQVYLFWKKKIGLNLIILVSYFYYDLFYWVSVNEYPKETISFQLEIMTWIVYKIGRALDLVL